MTLQVVEAIAPSHWASYLINQGDPSEYDLSTEDVAAIHAFIERQDMGWPCSCGDAGFRWRHDAMAEMPLGADCQTYSWLVKENT